MLIEIFCCYARKDQRLLKKLQTHLSPLERQGEIRLLADTDIDAGMEWEEMLQRYLNSANIILLLVSPDFIASDYCYSKEMKRAMERHDAKEAQVVPVILRPVLWEKLLFGKLQALPKDATPVTNASWHNSDAALYDVAKGIERIVFSLSRELEARRAQEAKIIDSVSKEPTASLTSQRDQKPKSTASQKGNALEEAVILIEQTILNTNPTTRNAKVTIEPRKLVNVDGVKHEIDLYVTIDHGNSYQSVFIFECKNWEKAVGKNEIIVFSEKINAVRAQKGFFVANSFGKYALEQAKIDGRIELLTASNMLDALPPFIDSFHYLYDNILHSDISLKSLTTDPKKVGRLAFTDNSRVKFRGEDLLLSEFTQKVQGLVESEHMNHEPTGTYKEGTYSYDVTKTFKFEPNELFVDGYECTELTARVQWESRVVRPKIVSQFDVKNRGQVISFESDNIPGGSLKVSFIATDDTSKSDTGRDFDEAISRLKSDAENSALTEGENRINKKAANRDVFQKLERLMPGLLDEMRQDLMQYPVRREFVLLDRLWTYWAAGDELCYFYNDHNDLSGMISILSNYNLVREITNNNVKRYLFLEELVDYLTQDRKEV